MSEPPPKCFVPESQRQRCQNVHELFYNKYNKEILFFARAPGRVNLIGEHIDYCGYAVLPMAIEQDIVIGVAQNSENSIRISNTKPHYKDFVCKTENIGIKTGSPDWYDYVLCGYKAVTRFCNVSDPVGMDMVVCGTIPERAGLSSSSALVSCSVLATVHIHSLQLSKLDLSTLSCKAECFVSSEDGGMDQAISFLAETGSAKLIEFNPLSTTNVKIPDGVVFVVSHSCVEINKAITSYYNIRVAECRVACQILAKSQGLNWRKVQYFAQLQRTLNKTLSEMLEMTEKVLHPEPYSKEEICNVLDVTVDELYSSSLNEKAQSVVSFELYKRSKHVFSEAGRVLQFKSSCGDSLHTSIQQLGELMNASHASCDSSFECSCPELNTLVSIARDSGAIGSRLTGAGWGGCVVSLVESKHLPSFLESLKTCYYDQDPQRKTQVTAALFATQPSHGAAIYTL